MYADDLQLYFPTNPDCISKTVALHDYMKVISDWRVWLQLSAAAIDEDWY